MTTNDTGDWRDLFDVALFEPNRVKLRKRIEHARQAINDRLGVLMNQQGEGGREVSERIALNARDAGLTLRTLTPQPATLPADSRLVRLPLPSLDAWVALAEFAGRLGVPQPKFDVDPMQQSADASTTYAAESLLLQSQRVIPLLHLRTAVALGANVMGWREDPDGSWRLQDVWLETEKP